MKLLYIKIVAYSMFLLLFTSCKKDETRVVAGTGTAPTLTSTAPATMVLTEANATANAGVFTWTASSFGFEGSVVSYTLQVGINGKNFADYKEVAIGSGLTTTITNATLNSMINQLNATNGVSGKVDVRIKATISATYPPAYSNVFTYNVTPYQIIIFYPSLYVPGDYENWAIESASRISSVLDNKMYEGYINFSVPGAFKLTPAPVWTHSYGSTSPGTIVLDGGDNLMMPVTGYYFLEVNTSELTWKATKTTFSVLGTAVGSETPLTLDQATGLWSVTKTLAPGTLSFKANGTGTTYGSASPANGKLVAKGTDIPVATAGTYKITFNVSIPGNFVYSIVAQ